MSIRWKIVLVCLPLIIGPLLATGYIASLSARNGITSVATEFLGFKLEQLMNYAYSQWDLLVANEMAGDPQFVASSKEAASSYARTLVKSETELILAVDGSGGLALATSTLDLGPESMAELEPAGRSGGDGLAAARAGRKAARRPGGGVRTLRLVRPRHPGARRLLPHRGPDRRRPS